MHTSHSQPQIQLKNSPCIQAQNQTTCRILNLDTAHYKCQFPVCGGVCCKNGRPGLYPQEIALIQDNLAKFLPLMRPAARAKCEESGFVTHRLKLGLPTMALSDHWCIFSNQGCVLQMVGTSEGEKWKYKPRYCVLFPLTHDHTRSNEWYVRQKDFHGEIWDLHCLERTPVEKTPAQESLVEEITYLYRLKN